MRTSRAQMLTDEQILPRACSYVFSEHGEIITWKLIGKCSRLISPVHFPRQSFHMIQWCLFPRICLALPPAYRAFCLWMGNHPADYHCKTHSRLVLSVAYNSKGTNSNFRIKWWHSDQSGRERTGWWWNFLKSFVLQKGYFYIWGIYQWVGFAYAQKKANCFPAKHWERKLKWCWICNGVYSVESKNSSNLWLKKKKIPICQPISL